PVPPSRNLPSDGPNRGPPSAFPFAFPTGSFHENEQFRPVLRGGRLPSGLPADSRRNGRHSAVQCGPRRRKPGTTAEVVVGTIRPTGPPPRRFARRPEVPQAAGGGGRSRPDPRDRRRQQTSRSRDRRTQTE